jgi:signal transduction histidine kinase/DNA-binding response OmpR family regulator
MPAPDAVNILIVDDLADKLLALSAVLESLDQNLVTARSGREALRLVMEMDFAVILLDVNMPEIDGFETAALIRQRRRCAHTPIIFITAFGDDLHTSRGYSLGAVDYILSPVVPEVLRTKVGVFVELCKKTEQVKRHAEERVALAHEQARRAVAEETSRHSLFLADASRALAKNMLNTEAILAVLPRLVVPQLADIGFVALCQEPLESCRAELAWTRAESPEQQQATMNLDQLPQDIVEAVKKVLEKRQPEAFLQLATDDGPADPGMPTWGLASAWACPLLARGRNLGVLFLGRHFERSEMSPQELALAEDLAGRAAIALDNARLYSNIQEADQRKNEFLAMLAHELRNPLAPIRNALHILRLGDVQGPDQAWAVDIMDRQIQHLVRLVDDLLEVSRITRGKIKLQCELVDVAAVVSQAIETSRPALEERAHQLSVRLPFEPLRLHADPMRLAQVLTNLLNNAAKFTGPKGQIHLTVDAQLQEVCFRIRDSGIGIPAEMLDSIFEVFFQGESTLDRTQGGLGIGLTLVKHLVELHGGTVHAFSAGAGQGSEFVVRLPRESGRKCD